jgi:vacuolar iron transporter family protein
MFGDDHDHTPQGIRARLSQGTHHSYLRDWVYGAIDGAVTTFAVVTGVAGGDLGSGVTIILGLANLLADGFSMAAGNFLGTRAEIDELNRVRAIEARHIRENPDGEREEIRQIYEKKGFAGDDLKQVVATLTADDKRWVDEMVIEEYGMTKDIRSPWRAAMATFAAFAACGSVPLLPYVMGAADPLRWSVVLTAIVFAIVGALKSRWSASRWWRSAGETVVVGSLAAALAYVLAFTLRHMVKIS